MLASTPQMLQNHYRLVLRRYMPVLVLWVVLLHVAAFYLLMQLKFPKPAVPVKKPIQVRIVDLKPPVAVTAPPKTETKPKPQPVVVEQPKPQPKIIATDKVTPKPAVVVPKVEQAAPVSVTQPVQPITVPKPATPVQPITAPAPKNDAPPSQPKPVQIDGKAATWRFEPKFEYTNRDLQNLERELKVKISFDEKGYVTDTKVIQSSGLKKLDDLVLRAIRRARLNPYKQNGVPIAVEREQTFQMTLNAND